MADNRSFEMVAGEIVAASSDAIMTLTTDGVVLDWNEGAAALYGYPASEIVGRHVRELVPPELHPVVGRRIARVVQGEPANIEDRVRVAQDGRRLIVSSHLFALHDAHGAIAGVGAIERDVSRSRAVEAELLRAKRMETVGRLARGAAQEVNNINTAILGLLDFALQYAMTDPQAHADLQQIRAHAIRSSDLARHIISFGEGSNSHGSIDVNDALQSMETLLRRLVGERVRVTLDLSAGELYAAIDGNELDIVVFELAARLTDSLQNCGRLDISTRRIISNGPPAVHQHAWSSPEGVELTMRAVDAAGPPSPDLVARSEEEPSAAIGFAVISSVLHRVGGWMESDAIEIDGDIGRRFSLFFPAGEVDRPVSPAPSDARPRDTNDETILLVEDEDAVRGVLARALRQFGFTVLEARNGGDALDVAQVHAAPIHAVVSDVVMPNMDGRALFDRLRTWYPNLRFLFVSGYATGAIGTEQLRGPITDFLPKPFSSDLLYETLRALLDRPRRNT